MLFSNGEHHFYYETGLENTYLMVFSAFVMFDRLYIMFSESLTNPHKQDYTHATEKCSRNV